MMNADQLAARIETILTELLAPEVFRQRVEPDATDVVVFVLGAPQGTAGSFSFAMQSRDMFPIEPGDAVDEQIRDMIRYVTSKYGCAAA